MKNVPGLRNQLFDLLRLLFATLVLLSHAFEFTYGTRSRELFSRLSHTHMSFGEIGVSGFFLLSGYLIVQSWLRDPELLNFLRKRLLRIVPGYLVAALLSTLVVGLAAPGIPHFLGHLGVHYAESVLLLAYPLTPPVFPGTHIELVNGAMWTISYEFRCYLLVALMGMTGLLRHRTVWLVLTSLFLLAAANPVFLNKHLWQRDRIFFGDLQPDCWLTAIFLVGGCYYLFRDRIRFRPLLACVAAAGILAAARWLPDRFEMAFVLCGSYLLFYLGDLSSGWQITRHRFPDVSYGVYLYGWPVLGLGIWYFHPSPWLLFVAGTVVCYGLGWLSWHFIERPMLTLKRHATAPLPPG